MKKILAIFVSLVLGLSLTGCLIKKDETKTVGDGVMVEPLSEDDSLEVIEEELNDTELMDFEAELDSLDEEINQL